MRDHDLIALALRRRRRRATAAIMACLTVAAAAFGLIMLAGWLLTAAVDLARGWWDAVPPLGYNTAIVLVLLLLALRITTGVLVGMIRPQWRKRCGDRAPVLFAGDTEPRRCTRRPHADAHHCDHEGYGWGEMERSWPEREDA